MDGATNPALWIIAGVLVSVIVQPPRLITGESDSCFLIDSERGVV